MKMITEPIKDALRTLSRSANEVRCVGEVLSYLSLSEEELSSSLPRGDGRPILVIPGFLCGDASTRMLRGFLRRLGYTVFGWRQGINWGPKAGVRTRLLHRVHEIHDTYEQPVTIIGWSLGGFYAREVACVRPDLVREVITLGSPIHGNPATTAVWHAFKLINRSNMPQLKWGEFDFPQPEGVPCLAVFSKSDGIVPWQYCIPQRGRLGESIRVRGSHIGLVANPEVMRILGAHLGSKHPAKAPARRARRQQRLRKAAAARRPLSSGRIHFERRRGAAPVQVGASTVGASTPIVDVFRFSGVLDSECRAHLMPVTGLCAKEDLHGFRAPVNWS